MSYQIRARSPLKAQSHVATAAVSFPLWMSSAFGPVLPTSDFMSDLLTDWPPAGHLPGRARASSNGSTSIAIIQVQLEGMDGVEAGIHIWIKMSGGSGPGWEAV